MEFWKLYDANKLIDLDTHEVAFLLKAAKTILFWQKHSITKDKNV